VHAAVADDDPDDTTYEHAHGGEVDVCSHAAMALPLLDLARRRAGNAWAGKVYRVDLCTHRACRASVARATVLCMYRCVYIRILILKRARSLVPIVAIVVARASRHVSRSRLQISDYVDGGGSGGRPIERAWYLSSAIRSGSAHCPAPASQARHSGAGIAIRIQACPHRADHDPHGRHNDAFAT
jgi:hypothetical protein